jgi:cyclopropane fatty-acyl-phospholipid synthase-like methyltransferase
MATKNWTGGGTISHPKSGKWGTNFAWSPSGVPAEHANLQLTAGSVVVDYGCGIGRLAKELISRYGCRVVGVDISSKSRALAERYVGSDRFLTCAPEGLDVLGAAFADAALAVRVLQHCPHVADDLHRIKQVLKPDGRLFVANEKRRFIPTETGWIRYQ